MSVLQVTQHSNAVIAVTVDSHFIFPYAIRTNVNLKCLFYFPTELMTGVLGGVLGGHNR